MPIASIILRPGLAYRRELFAQAFERLGFQISDRHQRTPTRGDVLVLWNRMRPYEGAIRAYEQAGAHVIIAENGYLPREGGKQFAIALGHHNGLGEFRPQFEPRFSFEPQPWRERRGDAVVILAQRGIGEIGIAQPHHWVRRAREKVRAATARPIIIRPHPGQRDLALGPDLDRAWAVLSWASGAALKAIMAGVPCFYGLGGWVGAQAATPWIHLAELIEEPPCPDRTPMLARLSWAQWSESEIASGEPFRRLLA